MFPLLVFLLFHFFSPAATDLAADGSALIAFRNAVGRMVLPWNTTLSPCKWKGVFCSINGVTSLRLPGRGLTGQIPAGTLGNLSNLRSISLRRNALFGPLPSDLIKCTHLHFLYLNQNRFSGQIPPFISSITSLIRLNLADNNFSGEIPLSLNNLTHLDLLYLESNDFSGEMPNLANPKLEQFNVSFNRLKGSVPEKLRGMPTRAFLGMSMCGGPLQSCLGGEATLKLTNSKSLAGGAIAGIAIGAFALFVLVLAVLFLFFRRKGKAEEANFTETPGAKLPELAIKGKEMAAASAPPPGIAVSKKQLVFLGNAPRLFDLEDLLRSSAEVLGKGKYGIVYKAALEESLVVAVKRLKNVKMPEKEFAEKIKAISAMEHPNLVPLRAYYYSREEKFLVYDYMALGSLSSLLHGNRGSPSPLKWETRIKIALEAARGIECIHSTSPSASHGNIKSSNVLITSSYRARVSEHGLSHLAPSSQNLTPEADVYNFGVLLLELVTGKAPVHGGRFVNLPRWVEETLIRGEGTRELFDEELKRFRSPEEEMLMLLQVGLDCTSQNPEHRPEISSVVAKIEEIRHWAARKKDKLKEKEAPLF